MKTLATSLKVDARPILLVGGGSKALQQLTAVLQAAPKAKVKVLAAHIHPQIIAYSYGQCDIRIQLKTFEDTDMKGASVVIAASQHDFVNNRIALVARAYNTPVFNVDDPSASDFELPKVVHKHHFSIAITSATMPEQAEKLSSFLKVHLPDDNNELMHALHKFVRYYRDVYPYEEDSSEKSPQKSKWTKPLLRHLRHLWLQTYRTLIGARNAYV